MGKKEISSSNQKEFLRFRERKTAGQGRGLIAIEVKETIRERKKERSGSQTAEGTAPRGIQGMRYNAIGRNEAIK